VTSVPTYEYICSAGHAFEAFQKISERPKTKCPTCGKPATRKISGGVGLVFKGSGFYITDYGKDGKGARKDPVETSTAPVAESTAPKPEKHASSGREGKTEAKTDAKPTESKKAAKPKAST
jgi:putative FmdB family regulatory protein